MSGERPNVQVRMTKPNARPPAITDVLRRYLQQMVDTAQITQAIVAIALQPDAARHVAPMALTACRRLAIHSHQRGFANRRRELDRAPLDAEIRALQTARSASPLEAATAADA
ncbi:MAG TPA: hypothetical protein VK504_07400 [Vicinamibacterales bacterium]|nr:hypothetical protein [Vicinamibacterales bacterium]